MHLSRRSLTGEMDGNPMGMSGAGSHVLVLLSSNSGWASTGESREEDGDALAGWVLRTHRLALRTWCTYVYHAKAY